MLRHYWKRQQNIMGTSQRYVVFVGRNVLSCDCQNTFCLFVVFSKELLH